MTRKLWVAGLVAGPLAFGSLSRVLEEQIRMGGSPWWKLVVAIRYVVFGVVLAWAAIKLLRVEADVTFLKAQYSSMKQRVDDAEQRLGLVADHVAAEQLLIDIERQAMAQNIADREAGIYDVKQ